MLNAFAHFLARHRLRPERIASYSVAIALHGAAALLLMIPMQAAEPLSDGPEEVVQVVFLPTQGSAAEMVVTPPPKPPAPPRLKSEAPTAPKPASPAPAEPTTAPVAEEGEIPVETMVLGNSPEFDELATLDLPQPDVPATEILSYRKAHQPVFPDESRRAGEGGWVTLRVLIDAEGLPLAFVLVKSTASGPLVQAAIDAVKKWRFNPAVKDGSPVASWVEVPIGFWSSSTAGNSAMDVAAH